MQSLYAIAQSKKDDLTKEEKFLMYSLQQMYDLFIILLQLMIEIRNLAENIQDLEKKKHLATEQDKNPNRRFVDNPILKILASNRELKQYIEKKKLNYWHLDDEYVRILWKEIKESSYYFAYMEQKEPSFKTDQQFLIDIFKNCIAPNEKLYDYLEDKRLTWIDDLPLVNTHILKFFKKIKAKHTEELKLPSLFKDLEDEEFAKLIFRKTTLNGAEYAKEIEGRTPNWDKDRIAELDKAIIKMAICEFTQFSSIPVKVTINEYLEIAKEYSTPKSSIFINGILDKISKEYKESGKLNKVGRGLM